MEAPLATAEAAIALLPQRAPFLLVDTLVSATADTFRSSFTIPEEHVLLSDGALLEAGLLENAAQTAALGMGHGAKLIGVPPPLGFIGAMSKVVVHGRALAGERLDTTVLVRHEVMNARVLEAKVERSGELIASLELKVFIIDAATNG